MRKKLFPFLILSLGAFLPFFGAGCKTYENSTTYFNTYYNMNRIMDEAEEEFEYQDEKKRVMPRVLFVDYPGLKLGETEEGQPKFLKAFMIEPQKLQPVRVKVDSIIIKGSKILAKYGKSDFIDNSLYLMAQAFFYRSEWVPSQEKCKELLEQFPESNFAPDASLLLSKDYLIQKKYSPGKTQLSRTIDIAWQQERYDILSEAFRLEAEMALYEKDFDGALRPYRQAIAQSDNSEQNARWQIDLGGLLYRQGKFAQAEKEFAKAKEFNPDVLTEFEAELYRASSLIHQEKFAQAEEILAELDRNTNYDEWKAYTFGGKLELARISKDSVRYDELTKHADTAFVGSKSVIVQHFERGMDYYRKNSLGMAAQYFARSKNMRSPVFDAAAKMYDNTTVIDKKIRFAAPHLRNIEKKLIRVDDTVRLEIAKAIFDAARAYENLGNLDSAKKYFILADVVSPETAPDRARFAFNHARIIHKENDEEADSLYELLVDKFGKTEYGAEARKILGFVADSETDTAADLFYSGSRFRNVGDYTMAQRQYQRVVNEFSSSRFAPRALYALGWLQENIFHNKDSAFAYYKQLTGKFPDSESAKDMNISVAFAEADRSGMVPPDSLLEKQSKKKSEKGETPEQTKINTEQSQIPDINALRRGAVIPPTELPKLKVMESQESKPESKPEIEPSQEEKAMQEVLKQATQQQKTPEPDSAKIEPPKTDTKNQKKSAKKPK